MAQAIAERGTSGEFVSFDDFAHRLDSKVVNKRILENLVKAGAMDWTGETRAGMHGRLEQVTASASSAQRDKAAGQAALFDSMDFASEPAAAGGGVEKVEEWSKDERLEQEKELLGFYVTGHPLDKFRGVVDSDRFSPMGLLDDLDISDRRARFPFAGMIRSIEHRTTKAGKPFGILVVEDFTGSTEVLCWAESYQPARDAGLLETGRVISFKGQVSVDDRTEARKLMASSLKELKPKRGSKNNGPVELSLWMARNGVAELEEIHTVLTAHPGSTPVWFHFQSGSGKRVTMECGEKFQVKRSQDLDKALAKWVS